MKVKIKNKHLHRCWTLSRTSLAKIHQVLLLKAPSKEKWIESGSARQTKGHQQVWVNTLLLIIKDNITTIYWRKDSRDSGNAHLYILKMTDFQSLFWSLVSLKAWTIHLSDESNKHPKCTFLLKPIPCRIHFVTSMQTQTVPFNSKNTITKDICQSEGAHT